MTDPFLSREIVRRITGKVRGTAQVRQLQRQGVKYLTNGAGEPIFDGDGFPLVPRDAVSLAGVHNIDDEPRFDHLERKAG